MKTILLISALCCLWSCNNDTVSLTITNQLAIDRSFETVEIKLSEIKSLKAKDYLVIQKSNGDTLNSQIIDIDLDGVDDLLLFQPTIKANSSEEFWIKGLHEKQTKEAICYARFVPERTDDYAWENNKVAFRTYGPTAQKMVEDSIQGGTLSSGIDAWLKRVEYPIINKWYQKHISGSGSYHEDTGEGLDNFHVGVSRGVGGIAIKNDSVYNVSKNFASYKTIATGPIRTVFELVYAPYTVNGKMIQETKLISLDYGQNLSKISVNLTGANHFSAGLTLHDNLGATKTNLKEGWMSYWEPHDGSELGQGLVIKNLKQLMGIDQYISPIKDNSHLYMQIRLTNNMATYYTGFGWQKSGQFKSKEAWETYLSNFSKSLQNPLKIKIK